MHGMDWVIAAAGFTSSLIAIAGLFYKVTVSINHKTVEKIERVHAQLVPNGGLSLRDDLCAMRKEVSAIKLQTDRNGAHLVEQDKHLANQDHKIDTLSSRIDSAMLVMAERRKSVRAS